MSEPTPDTSPGTDAGTTSEAPEADGTGSRPADDQGTDAAEVPAAPDGFGDDGGAALERAQDAIDEARDAEGSVAAHDDITTQDDALAGEYGEDPDGAGGHP